MQCFDPDTPPLDPLKEDYSTPINVICSGCGVSLPNVAGQRSTHQAFHDRIEPRS